MLKLLLLTICGLAVALPTPAAEREEYAVAATCTTAPNAVAMSYETESDKFNRTFIDFPGSKTWWTIGSMNVVEWWWSGTYVPNVRVVFSHPDKGMLASSIMLSDSTPANNFGLASHDPLTGAKPGKGYIVTLFDRANDTNAYAVSEPFELKPNGSTPTIPPPYGPQNPATATAVSGHGERVDVPLSLWTLPVIGASVLLGSLL